MSAATDVVDRQIAAFRDRDLDGFLRCYADGVKIRDFGGNVLMDGKEAMRGQYGPLFRDSRGDSRSPGSRGLRGR
ncbi:MAG: nuclear transport factor 2 family protein [Streptosporangiaceae bacterium]